jgi:hypothetical protein
MHLSSFWFLVSAVACIFVYLYMRYDGYRKSVPEPRHLIERKLCRREFPDRVEFYYGTEKVAMLETFFVQNDLRQLNREKLLASDVRYIDKRGHQINADDPEFKNKMQAFEKLLKHLIEETQGHPDTRPDVLSQAPCAYIEDVYRLKPAERPLEPSFS